MTKLFITLGPSTINKKFLSFISKKNIKLLRINLSHTNINDLPKIVSYIRKYSNIDICFDTEGACRQQKITISVDTGKDKEDCTPLKSCDEVVIEKTIIGTPPSCANINTLIS